MGTTRNSARDEGNPDRLFLKEALDRFDRSEAAFSEWRIQANRDLSFVANDQWEEGVRQGRESQGRPCLTADRISPAIRQIVNESRQNRPSIEVNAQSNGADEDTAHVIAGLIRSIEYQSNADIAYDTAEEYAVKIGLGYYRLVAEYDDTETFEQSLFIKLIDDPMCVFPDPDSREPDGSDQEFCFIVKEMTQEAYKRVYGDSKLAKVNSWKGRELNSTGWIQADKVRIAEYFYKEYKEDKLYHVARFLPNAVGELQFSEEDVLTEKPNDEDIEAKRVMILATRPVQKVTVKWCVLNGHEVLSETTFPGEHIPVFPVKGEDFWVNGKRVIMGAIRRARDTQRVINFMLSNQVEAVDLANKIPYIGAAGQFDTFEDKWRTANQKPYAYLEYNSVDVDGKPVPAPARQMAEVPIQAISTTRLQSDDDLKAIMGIYEAAQGAQGNETSGVAIVARKEQSSNSNFHYYDNLVRSIKHLGKVMVNIIPTYYDTERTIQIVKPDGQQELVAINQYIEEKNKTFDLTASAGKYSVMIKTGPTYQTKRRQLVETGTALIAQYPTAGPLIADLLVSASDFDGNQEIAARLRTQVPPEVLAATGEDSSQGDPKQQLATLQMKVQKNQKDLEALNTHAAETEQLLKQCQEELKLEKMNKEIELRKSDQTYDIAAQELALKQAELELAWESSNQKNSLAERQLAIQEAQMQIKAISQAANILTKPDKTINTISQIKPIDVEAISSDKDFTNSLDRI